ncbi:PREDICTED: snRNA-activating protein complex subunit 4 [Nanorana parkeri]|uniref:snRNA-activating protein complex subunit 4 n=1 Tax=Nanorana parkeri TaxID=125878 RepID=UPI0008549F54|nr:PREDICTED: snRNA-activating protein complex subunit 4 [Nanorana parkeri]
MCLQMNLVYQAVIEEKLQELEVLIAQNKEQQEELMWELAGRKTQRAGTSKLYPLNLAIGHFLKPYFKDKVTGVGPPANPEMKERSVLIVKTFQELTTKKWRSSDTLELRKAIFSDTLQRMLQPKMLKVEYLQQKHQNTKSDIEKKILTKQIHEAEREIDEINQLQEDALLGQRHDAHDWDKIANINFEEVHTSDRLCRMWQNYEHPHVNKEDWTEEEIEKLKEIATDHNFVDWQAIAQELGTNRTAFQCLQMFQSTNKGFKRSEFTKEEDEMLTHFVQRMRVGEHIPYNKIYYFMEGRDGLQLLYRWTKCLDPSLRKGPWSKEEDEMLLKAVAKHGEKDWYKIRFEVPGRSDVQCRERYLKGLHKDVKKGKWSLEEKEKLLELTSKYGVGHWAQVSKELPHRTGSQCLSKWKHITGYFTRRRLRLKQMTPEMPPKLKTSQKPPKEMTTKIKKDSEEEMSSASSSSESSFISSSSSSSSSESDDEAMELMDEFGGAEISNLVKSIPDLDLWIPRKRSLGLQDKSLLVYTASRNTKPPRTKKRKSRNVTFQFNTILKGIAYPPTSDTVTETVEDFLKEAEENSREILQIREEDILKILMRNTRENERKQIQRFRQSKRVPGSDTDQQDSRRSLSQLAVTRLYRASVDRKLLCAVARWIGNVFLPLSTCREKRFTGRTRVEVVEKKLSCVTITSTPIFTLLIQFFQIDAEGCLQMIQLQKVEEPEFCRKEKNTTKTTTKTARNTANSIFQGVLEPTKCSKNLMQVPSFSDQKPKPVVPQMTTETPPPPQKRRNSTPKIPRVRSVVPAPKLKTVSELLKEKRMEKLKALKAAQRTAVLSGNILVSPQILIQQPANQAVQPQAMVLPVAPTTLQNGSWSVRPFSPMPAHQAILPATTSSLGQENTEMRALVESRSQLAGSCSTTLTPSSASKVTCNTLPVVSSALKQVNTAAFSPAASWQKEASPHLPISAPSKASTMISQTLPFVTSSLGKVGTLVASSVTSQPQPDITCLPKAALAQGLPNKASQLKLTPQKYPIVKIAKLLQTNYPKEYTANVTSDPQSSSAPNNSCQTTNSERKNLDVKLISLEEEKIVKEWLLGKKGVEVQKQKIAIPYLPPSICTLKTFSRLLLEKKTLEQNALKLLPFSDVTEVGSKQMKAALGDMVEEKLKDNSAYQLIKQRFLSAFTIPGFLAVLPPTADSIKQDCDEDFEDLMDSETNIVEAPHKGIRAAVVGNSVGNISGGATPILTEQLEVFINHTKRDPGRNGGTQLARLSLLESMRERRRMPLQHCHFSRSSLSLSVNGEHSGMTV